MTDPTPPATLLFVDDEANILAALKRLFRTQNHRILTAGSGQEGLALVEREAVDLVISDMRMPEMDGAQFLERVRAYTPQAIRILLTGHADMAGTIAAINRGEIYRYVSKPWNDDELLLTVRDALRHKRLEAENTRLNALTRKQNEALKALNASLEHKVAERTEQLRRALLTLEHAHRVLKDEFLNSVTVFSSLIELRGGQFDARLAGHGRRVANAAQGLAQHLKLEPDAVQDVMLAGLLHDIGKIALPDELLNTSMHALSPEQRAQVKKHPTIGENVLMAIEELKGAKPLIRHHHECYDGSGYPDGLAGNAIPLGARILAVANDYDALQLGTVGPCVLNAAQALDWLLEQRGKRYDARIVDAFVAAGLPEAIPGRASDATTATQATGVPLRPIALAPGMVLAEDLTHHDGYLLLARNHMLDRHQIELLADLEEREQKQLILRVRAESMPPDTDPTP
ncbi:MAG: response regulator [Rhodocyclaceae bacterium]|nr:response regulator [Rhodocyclaceae bacterium]